MDHFAYTNGSIRADLAALHTQGFDLNSVNVDPQYYSTSDLHTCNDSIDGLGIPSTFVTTDFDGNPRNILILQILELMNLLALINILLAQI